MVTCRVLSSEKRSRKRNRREKTATKKKRDPTMYNMFLRQRMKEERIENPSRVKLIYSLAVSFVELSKKLSKEWNSMPEEKKRVYCENFKKLL